LTIWDVGDCDKIRPLIKDYLVDKRAVVFVIDSFDRKRLDEARELIWYLLTVKNLINLSLLIYLNKIDKTNGMTIEQR
jgi:GTPase SAR1 family protein